MTTHHGSGTDGLDTAWMVDAACINRPDLGWLKDPDRVGLGEEAAMAMVCEHCPVHVACAVYADDAEVTAGFWAGHHRTTDGPMLPLEGDAA